WGANFRIRSHMGDGSFTNDLEIYPGSSEIYLRTNQTRILGELVVSGNTTMRNGLYMDGHPVNGITQLRFKHGGVIESQAASSNMVINPSNKLVVFATGSQAFLVDSSHIYINRNMSMEGNDITNQSDERLKENI